MITTIKLTSSFVTILLLLNLFKVVKCDDEEETLGDKCRELAKKEKWSEAIKICSQVLSDRKKMEDGEEYHVLIARARALLNDSSSTAGSLNEGLKDLDEAIGQKAALTGPYWIRAEINLKLGDFGAARKDLERFDESPRLTELRRQIDRAEMEMRMAREAVQQKNWRGASERSSSVLRNYSPFLGEAQSILQNSVLKLKDYKRALKLLKDAKVDENDEKNAVLLAKIEFATGEFKSALNMLKNIKSSDAAELKSFFQEIVDKFEEIDGLLLRPSITELEKLQETIKTKSKAKLDEDMPDLMTAAENKILSLLCFKYAKVKNSEKAVEVCRSAMTVEPKEFVEHSLSLAEAYGHLEQHDDAVKVLETASRKHPRENRLQEALKAAQKARHEAANPDYYNILGVPRDASEKQIKMAYRRLAQKYHPDKMKNTTPEQKRAAELKMGQINRAHDVLGNKEKRAQFDRGIDPENPQANPFGAGGGGPGGFAFNFGGPGGFGGGGDADGGFPFEFIFQAMHQQQGGRGGGAHHQRHRQQQQQQQQFHFNFKDDL